MLFFLFFNDTATTEIYTLSLHDALPISRPLLRPMDTSDLSYAMEVDALCLPRPWSQTIWREELESPVGDRKSTRLNSSHANISYAVFCLKKKTKRNRSTLPFVLIHSDPV